MAASKLSVTTIAWIRRSLRKFDNTALVEASKEHDQVLPFYVIDQNYFSKGHLGYPRVRFWNDSLRDLKENLESSGSDLVVRKGKPGEELERIIDETGAEKLYFNRDYSPYSRERDRKARNLDIEVESFKDLVMFEKKEITTNEGDPYSVYSYYRDKWFDREKRRPRKPESFSTPDTGSDDIPSVRELGFEQPSGMNWIWNPCREGAMERLEDFKNKIGDYDQKRDYPEEDATSRLSPHLKFGTVSVREVFWEAEKLKSSGKEGVKTWQEELAWRDFYFQMLWNHPRTVDEPYLEKYSGIEWRSKEEAAEDWQRFVEGKTGFPFVDAGMRQLKKEGWMHNRLRMVVTSFAAKDLMLDWRDIHDYFRRMFVDAELSAMIGGIQWAYSIGTDAQPYFRVFNPWTQGEKFDPEGKFIRGMIPELEDVPDEYIHRPHEMPEDVQKSSDCRIGDDYPGPIVNHSERRERAIEMFEKEAS